MDKFVQVPRFIAAALAGVFAWGILRVILEIPNGRAIVEVSVGLAVFGLVWHEWWRGYKERMK